jgi:hypothetical protein
VLVKGLFYVNAKAGLTGDNNDGNDKKTTENK